RAPGRERADDEPELTPPVGEGVRRTRGMLRVEAARDEPGRLHELEALGEQRGRDAGKRLLEILEAPGARQQVAHDEQRPALAPRPRPRRSPRRWCTVRS